MSTRVGHWKRWQLSLSCRQLSLNTKSRFRNAKSRIKAVHTIEIRGAILLSRGVISCLVQSTFARKPRGFWPSIHAITDAKSKAALIEMADDLNRWADELDGIDPPQSNGA
jgi:hypothetical protein